MKALKIFAAFLLLSVAVLADGPKAVITDANGGVPPEEVQAGEALFLSAQQSVAGEKPNSIIWIIKPQARAERSRTYGRELCIPLGTKECDLVITQIAALGDEAAYAEITIHVKGDKTDPDPGPEPIPVPPSEGITAIVKASLGPTATNASLADKLKLLTLSTVFKGMAERVTKGEVTTVDQLLDMTKAETEKTLGNRYAELWKPTKTLVEQELQRLGNAGKLPDVKSHVQVWIDIASGIDRAVGV